MITEYQQKLRERYIAAPVMPAPEPWQPVLDRRTPIGGLLGIGFAVHPDSAHDLVMVVSGDGQALRRGNRQGRQRPRPSASSSPARESAEWTDARVEATGALNATASGVLDLSLWSGRRDARPGRVMRRIRGVGAWVGSLVGRGPGAVSGAGSRRPRADGSG
ncbi:hypothetical protein SLUN_01940 [Streptomyces lunaelactis]|uniref:Uncharacterized protein n=1 Tax=Streptomyces lunaelactis TaxID=1535768 RepID=A0A2R4SWC2_9ACTN|nr:hypothetical protein SLUN_01940 [Streptomyces lunaelactis]